MGGFSSAGWSIVSKPLWSRWALEHLPEVLETLPDDLSRLVPTVGGFADFTHLAQGAGTFLIYAATSWATVALNSLSQPGNSSKDFATVVLNGTANLANLIFTVFNVGDLGRLQRITAYTAVNALTTTVPNIALAALYP